jgi:hypothetical protein
MIVPLSLMTRDAPDRVHGSELRRIKATKLTACLNVLVPELQLDDQPHDFLNVERAASSPNRQHLKTSAAASALHTNSVRRYSGLGTGGIDDFTRLYDT